MTTDKITLITFATIVLIYPTILYFRSFREHEEYYICFYGNEKSLEEHSSSITKEGKEQFSIGKSSQEMAHKTQRNLGQLSSFSPEKNSPLNQSTTESSKRISFITPDYQNDARKFSNKNDKNDNNDINDDNNNDNRHNVHNNSYKSSDECGMENSYDPVESMIRTDNASNKTKSFTQKIVGNGTEKVDEKNDDCMDEKEKIGVGEEEKEGPELRFLKISLKKKKNINGLFSISVKKEILRNENSTTDLKPFILEFKNLFGTYDNYDRTAEKEKKEMICVLPDSGLLCSWTASSKNVPKNDPENVPCYSSSCRTENDKVTNMLIIFKYRMRRYSRTNNIILSSIF